MVKFLNVFTCIIDLPSRGGIMKCFRKKKQKQTPTNPVGQIFFFEGHRSLFNNAG